MAAQLPNLVLRDHCKEEAKILRARGISDFQVIVPPTKIKSYSHKVSPTWMLKHYPNMDNDRHANAEGDTEEGRSYPEQRTAGN